MAGRFGLRISIYASWRPKKRKRGNDSVERERKDSKRRKHESFRDPADVSATRCVWHGRFGIGASRICAWRKTSPERTAQPGGHWCCSSWGRKPQRGRFGEHRRLVRRGRQISGRGGAKTSQRKNLQ